MKPLIFIFAVVCCPVFAFSQDLTGLWKGTMYNDSTKQSLEYEIVINKDKGKYNGLSYTSYVIEGQKYYGIKKINVRVAKDGKIVMQDAKWVENTYTGEQHKNVIQLNVLALATSGEDYQMDGLFVTNDSKTFRALTGRMSIQKVKLPATESKLTKYIQKGAAENNLTASN